jgi:hypothetical protein
VTATTLANPAPFGGPSSGLRGSDEPVTLGAPVSCGIFPRASLKRGIVSGGWLNEDDATQSIGAAEYLKVAYMMFLALAPLFTALGIAIIWDRWSSGPGGKPRNTEVDQSGA